MMSMVLWATLCLSVQEPAAPTGPVAYYKLDESTGTMAVDTMGGPTGTYTGTPTQSTTVVAPPFSYPDPRSIALNGTSQAVTITNFGSFPQMSVSVWVNRSGTTGTRQSIVSYKEGNGVNMGFVLCLNENGSSEYPRIWVMVNGAWLNAESAVAVPTGTWTHLVGSYDGTAIRLYVNGALAATTGAVGSMTNTGSQNCVIGARADSAQHWFPGIIDDVRIYSRGLTLNEVGVLYAGCPAPTGLTATPGINQIALSWTAPTGPAVTYTYNVKRRDSPLNPFVTVATVSGTTYTDNTGLLPFTTYEYEITAVSIAESGPSGTASGMIQLPPPRTQKLGNGEHCGCSTAGVPGPLLLGVLGLVSAALLLAVRNR